MSKGFGFILITLLFLAVVGLVTMDQFNMRLSERINKYTSPQPTLVPVPTVAPTPVPTLGVIEGALSYPSEGIPEEMKICAISLEDNQEYCTSEHIKNEKYKYGEGYKLKVPPGRYHVYSMLPGDDYRAYYNEFVICGLAVECESHEPISVVVSAGQTRNGVDPQDWYDNTGSVEVEEEPEEQLSGE